MFLTKYINSQFRNLYDVVDDADILKEKLNEMQNNIRVLEENNCSFEDNITKINDLIDGIERQIKDKEDTEFFSELRNKKIHV